MIWKKQTDKRWFVDSLIPNPPKKKTDPVPPPLSSTKILTPLGPFNTRFPVVFCVFGWDNFSRKTPNSFQDPCGEVKPAKNGGTLTVDNCTSENFRMPKGSTKIQTWAIIRIPIQQSVFHGKYPPGDSSRDLLIPKRWRSLSPWKGHLTIQKGHKELPGTWDMFKTLD